MTKTTLGSIVSSMIIIGAILYGYHIMSGATTCERISNATKPIRMGADFVTAVASPWTDAGGVLTIANARKSAELSAAKFMQKYNGDVRCGWDRLAPLEPVSAPLFSGPQIPDLPAKGQ